ncbi:MAG TPA: parallel beta-helix domain-containing protein [Kofleriaceae bacterium]|nr:parallel beta-helix domain-containing protein [Kofleriaceae bacterium]
MRRPPLAPLILAALAACSSDEAPPCEGPNGPCIELAPSGGDDHGALQTALIEAAPGDVIYLAAGTYEVSQGLSLAVDDVTLRGAGMDETVISFAGQVDGAQGLLVTADGFTAEDLAVMDTAGDGIKVEGGARVIVRRVRVEWSGTPSQDNGAYGLYPVQCTDVLIEDSLVRGASDAGIYVGQSERIVVRRNRVERNVAGIEIENSFDADVFENTATENTGGVLVFNLPGLQVQNGSRTRVFDNEVFDNNWPNFAPEGNIVGKVPQGTGIALLAAHQVELFGNRIADNQTVNAAAISYYMTQLELDDPEYDPFSDTIYIHDNEFSGGGDRASGELGFALLAALNNLEEPPEAVPDIVFDGIMDPDKMDGDGLAAEFNLCIREGGDADFVNLDAEHEFAGVSLDMAPHDCEHPALPAVELDGIDL